VGTRSSPCTRSPNFFSVSLTRIANVITNQLITGLILAGGRGSRMGGVDKGLQPLRGRALVEHVLGRLRPQVGPVLINANRNTDAYAAFGVPVLPDEVPDYAGPLAGFLTGLAHCQTPYLLTAPCDSPLLPLDLAERLANGLMAQGADVAMAITGDDQLQPVFCLMRREVSDSLRGFMQGGGRKIDAWTATISTALVAFDDVAAFANANTAQELDALERAALR
jgi:molybdenum cofactor guanylyltransferase